MSQTILRYLSDSFLESLLALSIVCLSSCNTLMLLGVLILGEACVHLSCIGRLRLVLAGASSGVIHVVDLFERCSGLRRRQTKICLLSRSIVGSVQTAAY